MGSPQVGDLHVKSFRFQVGVQPIGKFLLIAGGIIFFYQEKAAAFQIGKVHLPLFVDLGFENHVWDGKGAAVGADWSAARFLPAGLGIADGGGAGICGSPDQIEPGQMGIPVVGLLRLGQGGLAEQGQQEDGDQNQRAFSQLIHRSPPIVRRNAGYLPRRS